MSSLVCIQTMLPETTAVISIVDITILVRTITIIIISTSIFSVFHVLLRPRVMRLGWFKGFGGFVVLGISFGGRGGGGNRRRVNGLGRAPTGARNLRVRHLGLGTQTTSFHPVSIYLPVDL